MRLDDGQIEVMDDAMAEVYRGKSVAERLRIANGMFRFARQMIRCQVRAERPEWTDTQVNREAGRRLLDGSV